MEGWLDERMNSRNVLVDRKAGKRGDWVLRGWRRDQWLDGQPPIRSDFGYSGPFIYIYIYTYNISIYIGPNTPKSSRLGA